MSIPTDHKWQRDFLKLSTKIGHHNTKPKETSYNDSSNVKVSTDDTTTTQTDSVIIDTTTSLSDEKSERGEEGIDWVWTETEEAEWGEEGIDWVWTNNDEGDAIQSDTTAIQRMPSQQQPTTCSPSMTMSQ